MVKLEAACACCICDAVECAQVGLFVLQFSHRSELLVAYLCAFANIKLLSTLQYAEALEFLEASATECYLQLSCHSLRCGIPFFYTWSLVCVQPYFFLLLLFTLGS